MPFKTYSSSSSSRKRRLLDDPIDSFQSLKMLKSEPKTQTDSECARLVSTNQCGREEVIVLTLDKPVTIGRCLRECTYVIADKVVSNVHCKFYAVMSSTGGVLVSCHDYSTNGVILNGRKLRRNAAIVMDGDEIQIPNSKVFKCILTLKEPREHVNIFEQTPPQGVYKNLEVGYYTITSHCLGSGSYASVHLAFDALSSRQVACKTIITKSRRKEDMQKAKKEVNILRGLKHPNINGILDVEVNTQAGWLHIFLEARIKPRSHRCCRSYFLLKLCTGGDLFTYTTRRYRLSEAEAKFITFQLFRAIEYLHDRSVSHRDLKVGTMTLLFELSTGTQLIRLSQPENILLYTPGPFPRVQIADFGLARARAYQETMTVCGTVSYLPPEGIMALDNRELGYIGMPADCWSVGLILFIMLSGEHPFDYPNESNNSNMQKTGISASESQRPPFAQRSMVSEEVVKTRIIKCSVEFTNVWDTMLKAKDLADGLLVRDYKYRTTIKEALQSRWITADLEELVHDYNERISN